METKLKEILALVIEWVKFAEAKNAGLLVLNSSSIFALLSVYKDLYEIPHHNGIKLAAIMFVLMSFCSIWYVIESITAKYDPQKIQERITKKREKLEREGLLAINNVNLTFYGDLANLSRAELLSKLQNEYGLIISSKDKLEKDLADQVLINSNIALDKFELFNKGIVATRNAFLISVAIVIISELFCYFSLIK